MHEILERLERIESVLRLLSEQRQVQQDWYDTQTAAGNP